VVLAGDAQGRDGYLDGLRRRIAQFGLADRVRLVGHVDDMPAAFALAHVSVVASTEPEAFGRVAIESQAMGCPVIATAIGAPPETVIATPANAATGWLVPPAAPAPLAAALADALALTPTARHVMGERARDHVVARFVVRGMQAATLGVYDRLLGTDFRQSFDAR
jgi:glycosyltransferase involved in cell wall biosynthesis